MLGEDLTGKQFGSLSVVKLKYRKSGTSDVWYCLCTCGALVERTAYRLNYAAHVSCGCMRQELARKTFLKHGLSQTSEYKIWQRVVLCCRSEEFRDYCRYGGRGVDVCSRWVDGEAEKSGFECFYQDMGPRPSKKHSIDRIDNDGDYEPGNCRWATPKQQMRNRGVTKYLTVRGVRKSLADWADDLGVKYDALYARVRRGWDHEMIVDVPVVAGQKVCNNTGVTIGKSS